MTMVPSRIVSGGQTGVDRGALDAALAKGFPCGGWCPQGRKAEDGVIPSRYPLQELAGAGYRQRTHRNVMDADATLIIYFDALPGGTGETARYCERLGKPMLSVDGTSTDPVTAAERAAGFLHANAVRILNVAGPRESQHHRAHDYAEAVIRIVLKRLQQGSQQ